MVDSLRQYAHNEMGDLCGSLENPRHFVRANKRSKQNQIKISEAKGERSHPKMVWGKSEITEEHKEHLS